MIAKNRQRQGKPYIETGSTQNGLQRAGKRSQKERRCRKYWTGQMFLCNVAQRNF